MIPRANCGGILAEKAPNMGQRLSNWLIVGGGGVAAWLPAALDSERLTEGITKSPTRVMTSSIVTPVGRRPDRAGLAQRVERLTEQVMSVQEIYRNSQWLLADDDCSSSARDLCSAAYL